MTKPLIFKDPDTKVPVPFTWVDYLPSGETVTTSTFTISPSGALLEDSTSIATPVTQIVLTAGTLGADYTVTNKITTTPSGFTEEQSITVRILDK